LEETAEALDIGGLTSQLAALKAEQEDPEVWQDLERSKKIGREVSSVESKIASYEKSKKAVDERLDLQSVIVRFKHIYQSFQIFYSDRL